MLASAPALPPRRWPPPAAVLAAAARATAHLAGAASVGIVATLVWRSAGRAWVVPAVALVAPAELILCDLVPRGLAAVVLAPLLAVERGLGRLLGRPDLPLAVLRQLGAWLAARPARGPLEVSEAGLVARIARFTAKTARDVSVAHVDVCAVPDTASVAEVVALVQERGFSRLPVFHERMFNTIGVVSSLDLLGEMDPHLPVTAVMREPLFVPESKPLPELLSTLQAEGRNLALVVDEYGGFVGLVTVEDVVQEIVGEIQDEYDAPQEHVRRVAPAVFVVM